MALAGGVFSLWFVFAWLACGALSAHVAAEKDRCGPCWFIWGVLFGPMALLATVGLPSRDRQHVTHMRCHMCHEFVLPTARKCKHCQVDFAPDGGPEGKEVNHAWPLATDTTSKRFGEVEWWVWVLLAAGAAYIAYRYISP